MVSGSAGHSSQTLSSLTRCLVSHHPQKAAQIPFHSLCGPSASVPCLLLQYPLETTCLSPTKWQKTMAFSHLEHPKVQAIFEADDPRKPGEEMGVRQAKGQGQRAVVLTSGSPCRCLPQGAL